MLKWWKFGQFLFFSSFFGNNSKVTRIIFVSSWLCASQSLANAFFVSIFFGHFWKFYKVFCFVVHLHWNDMSVHSSSLTCTVFLIISFSLPFCWWQFEIVWFVNNVYRMPICFKEMLIYGRNSLCFWWCLHNALYIFL